MRIAEAAASSSAGSLAAITMTRSALRADSLLALAGFRFHIYAEDGDDLGVRTFSEPNWKPGDTIALRDRVYRVRDVVLLDRDADDDVRGMLMIDELHPDS